MKKFMFSLLIATVLLSCTNYGDKVSKGYLEVYYKDGASKEEAQKTLDYLYPKWSDSGDDTQKKSIQLTKTGDTVNFRMVADMDKMDKMDAAVFYTTGNEISQALGGTPVNVVLTDNKFNGKRTYAFRKTELPNYGEKVTRGNIEVYAKEGFSYEHAENLADYLEKELHPENEISFQVGRGRGEFYTVKMASTAEAATTITKEMANDLMSKMSANVFNNAPLIFELTDQQFQTIKKFEYNTEAYPVNPADGEQ